MKARRNKKRDENDINTGILALKINFEKKEGELCQEEPVKLVCYGSLPNQSNQVLKVFEGKNCALQFVLWLLSNVLDYKIDNRIDPSSVVIFTIGGAEHDLPCLLRELIKVCGRDVSFFGDLGKVKSMWHECIRFIDLNNFFEFKTFDQFVFDWL